MLKAQAIGNLGQDAKIKEVNGRLAIQFSIAVNEAFTNKDNVKVEKTTWLNCTMWKDNANKTKVAEFLKKGTQVYIEFKPTISTYEDQNGKVQASMNCNVTHLNLLGGNKTESKQDNHQEPGIPEYNEVPLDENDNSGCPY